MSATDSLSARRVIVEVPATTANLGAGFDALGLALELANRVEVEAVDSGGVELAVEGEGGDQLTGDRDNAFVRALEVGIRAAGRGAATGWRIAMTNHVPLGRGLGSSAAATVAGLLAADAFTGLAADPERTLALAAGLEGHADNAAAAILGGFVVVAFSGARPSAVRLEPPADLRCVVFVPDLRLETQRMRDALPAQVPRADAVFNVGRAALAVAAFATGRLDLLRDATEDRLHEQYRAAVYPALPALVRAAREAGALGACLSGAGSTVIAFVDSERLGAEVERALVAAARASGLAGVSGALRPRSDGGRLLEVA